MSEYRIFCLEGDFIKAFSLFLNSLRRLFDFEITWDIIKEKRENEYEVVKSKHYTNGDKCVWGRRTRSNKYGMGRGKR